jgi:hypothetical protein
MNLYCWDPGFYTAISIACVTTGDVEMYMKYIVKFMFFYVTNKLHTNNACTAI